MANINPETLSVLKDKGYISEDTYKIGSQADKNISSLKENLSNLFDLSPHMSNMQELAKQAGNEYAGINSRLPAETKDELDSKIVEQTLYKAKQPTETSQEIQKEAVQSLPKQQESSFAGSQGMFNQALQLGAQGIEKEAKAEEEKSKMLSSSLEKYQKDLDSLQKKQEEVEKDFDAKAIKTDEELNNWKLDPSRKWKNSSTGNKILAGVSIFLGGFDPSGRNKALEIIENSIQRDIEAQKAEYEKLKDKKTNLSTTYSQMVNRFGNQKTALQMTHAAELQRVGAEFDRLAASAKSDKQKSLLLQQGAEFKNKAEKATLEARSEFVKNSQTLMKQYIPDLGGYSIGGESEVKELREKTAKSKGVINSLNSLLNMNKEDFASLDRDKKAKVETEINTLVGNLRLALVGPGPLTESEREFILDSIGNPSKLFSLKSANKIKLETLANKVREDVYNTARSQGIYEVPEFFVPKKDFSSYKVK